MIFAGTDTGFDILYGDAGNDTIYAGDGNDTISGGDSNDTAYGEGGSDLYSFGSGCGNDVFDAGKGDFDEIQLVGPQPQDPPSSWLHMDQGSYYIDPNDGTIHLSAGSEGTITFADGSTLHFFDVEHIFYA